MRGIQYAAASRLHHWRLWNTGSSGQAGRWHGSVARYQNVIAGRRVAWMHARWQAPRNNPSRS